MLMGHANLLKVKMPPKFIRVAFIRVSYIPREAADRNSGLWTRMILNAEYLPPMSLTGNNLKELLERLHTSNKKEKEIYPKLLNGLKQIRAFLEVAEGHFVVNGIMIASLIIMLRLRRH